MGTMRRDSASLWTDPRQTEIEIGRALEIERQKNERKAPIVARGMPASLAIAGASFAAAMGLKLIGLDRAARLVAWLVPSVLLIAALQELSMRRATAS